MTKITLLIFGVLLSQNVFAATGRSNALLRFVAHSQGLRTFVLSLVMQDRCDRYLSGKAFDACAASVDETVELLDFDILMNLNAPLLLDENDPESFVFVAFRKDFLNLLESPETLTYLHLINEKLNRFMTGQDSTAANLWETSVEFYGSKKRAAQALATLFQDTSPNKLHLAWLDRKHIHGSNLFTENKEILTRLIDTINFIMDTTDVSYRTLFYPPTVQSLINRNIYHFYVPLYLAQSLEASGFKKSEAVLGPLMLTLTYEFITSAPDLRYVFKDPKKIEAQALIDIFAGHAGGRMGVSLPFSSLQTLAESFETSTETGIGVLLKN